MGMDRLMQAIGAESLDWSYKTECCGGSLVFAQLAVVMDICRKLLDNAKNVGAEAIVIACPLCQANLDMRQRQMEKRVRPRVQSARHILYATDGVAGPGKEAIRQ
jgi:heterodisulfide reductase subunit B